MIPPPNRKAPDVGIRDSSENIATGRVAYPILPEGARNLPAAAVVAELQKYAASVGLSLTCRCARCGSPLWNARSVSAKLGPSCRRIAGKAGDSAWSPSGTGRRQP